MRRRQNIRVASSRASRTNRRYLGNLSINRSPYQGEIGSKKQFRVISQGVLRLSACNTDLLIEPFPGLLAVRLGAIVALLWLEFRASV